MILQILSDVQSLPNKRIKQAFIMSHLFFIAVQCISSYFPLFCSHAISQQFTCDQNQPTAELRPFWSKRFDQCLDPDGIASADDHHLTKNHQEQTMAKLRKLSFTEKWREYLEVYRALRVKRFLGDPGHCSFTLIFVGQCMSYFLTWPARYGSWFPSCCSKSPSWNQKLV